MNIISFFIIIFFCKRGSVHYIEMIEILGKLYDDPYRRLKMNCRQSNINGTLSTWLDDLQSTQFSFENTFFGHFYPESLGIFWSTCHYDLNQTEVYYKLPAPWIILFNRHSFGSGDNCGIETGSQKTSGWKIESLYIAPSIELFQTIRNRTERFDPD